MLTRLQVSILVGLTMLLALLWLGARGEQPTSGAFAAIFGVVVSAVYGLVLLFSHFAWSWLIFRGWLVKRPDLRGTWKATLRSDWNDPNSNQASGPIEAYVVVRQTLTTLSMRLFSDKSRSVLVAHSIENEPDGLFSLSAVYRNSPKIQFEGPQGAIHHGALLIEVHEVKPKHLEGHYWTDRGTCGTIELVYWNDCRYSSFEDAKRALEGA
jgi:hypothetical protein